MIVPSMEQQPPAGPWMFVALIAACGLTVAAIRYDERSALHSELLSADTTSQPDDPAVIRAIQHRGGRVFVDGHGCVVKVIWHRVPLDDDDLQLLQGLQHLTTLNLRGVSRAGRAISDQGLEHLTHLPNLHTLDLSSNFGITDQGLIAIGKIATLKWLNLVHTQVTNAGLKHLKGLNQLQELQLSSPSWYVEHNTNGKRRTPTSWGCTPSGLPALWGLPIKRLTGVWISNDNLHHLRGFPQLREWDGCRESIADDQLVHLRMTRELTSLDVRLTDGWANTSRLRLLSGWPHLQTLTISGSRDDPRPFDPQGLRTLQQLPELQTLRLGGINDSGLLALPSLQSLTALDLTGSRLTGIGLTGLSQQSQLGSLALDRHSLDSSDLSCLPDLPQLWELRLDGSRPWESFQQVPQPLQASTAQPASPLAFLQQVPNLRGLYLCGLPIHDSDLVHLREVPQLERLSLTLMQTSDRGMSQLATIPQLKLLRLDGTAVTDRALDTFPPAQALRGLWIHGIPITWEAATRFHHLHPECFIDDNWCCGCMAFGSLNVADLDVSQSESNE